MAASFLGDRSGLPSFGLSLFMVLFLSCGGDGPQEPLAVSEFPLHLEELLERAEVTAKVSGGGHPSIHWDFQKPSSEARPLISPQGESSRISHSGDSLVLSLTARTKSPGPDNTGGVVLPVPDLDVDDWGEIMVRARTRKAGWLSPAFNLGERYVESWDEKLPVRYLGQGTPLISDGQAHLYRLRADQISPQTPAWEEGERWRELVLMGWSRELSDLEILEVAVLPKLARYAGAGAGLLREERGNTTRGTVYSHVPGKITYPVRLPAAARLDWGLAVLQRKKPVTFRVTVGEGEQEEELFSQSVDSVDWRQQSLDLSKWSGRTVNLSLHAEGEPGALGLWASPSLSGQPSSSGPTARPRVIFYVIDGAGADLMSLYGYPRRTTPALERIAAEGVLFEHAYSNSGWTKPSTSSFMTSLQQSVLGGRTLADQIPAGATTMAEHFHRAGYQTATFNANPWAGKMNGLERGVDWFLEEETNEDFSVSSRHLQEAFWAWRRHYPGQPYWAHFQTTDVHEPHRPAAPFAGLFVSPERRAWFWEIFKKMREDSEGRSLWRLFKDPQSTLADLYRQRLLELKVDPREFFNIQRGLYDETMAHQDHQLGRLVERLKAEGEWEQTLLVVASDHGHPAGSFSRFGRELFDPLPESDEGALLDSYRSHIPLLFVWPGRLPAGRRVSQPVSMIDVLPTLLELAGLPAPEVLQGQSLVPLLKGESGWQPRPVILEQYQPVPDQNALVGHIEIIDGRWGASLEIWPADLDPAVARPSGNQRAARPHRPGMPPIYLYDLWNDPFATRRVNDQHPELVEKYSRILTEQWEAHQALAKKFQPGKESELTPEQLQRLRSLGYIQ